MPFLNLLMQRKYFRIMLPILWIFSATTATVLTITLLLISISGNASNSLKYTIYSAKPLVLGASTSSMEFKNSRSDLINEVFKKYNCPMENLGEKFVKEADKNNIPFWIVPAIAFQESSCGKQTPIKNGEETYNAYGYGVWGDNITSFEDWEHGIEVMSRYMSQKFYSQGITEPCEIMKIYTPPSQGSWCNGIEFFREQIVEYRSPNYE